ncbi:MAG: tocopherol cyclase family protein [Anaerolineae bacterium]
MSYFRTLFKPELYHGESKKAPFFEGWYYKLVDPTEKHRFAVIPGIFKNDDPELNHSFIQVLNGSTGQSAYHRFSRSSFKSESRRFAVNVGQNHFSETRLALNIKDPDFSIGGTLILGETAPWPSTFLSPGIMGPYGYLPNMECNHGIVSLNHELIGHLIINGEKIVFTGGKGYIEKDWGRSFPAGYVWMQSNHFSTYGTSFIGSIAIIPWRRYAFPGFIIGLKHKGFLHRFATYTGAKTQSLKITDDDVEWVIKSRRKTLIVNATRTKGGLLYGPNRDSMTERVGETLLSDISLTLKDGTTTILNDTGRCAGLEVHGDLEQLLALQK